MKQDYYIGLDMGTESVGWAVTDVEYNLVKKRGQDYWGVYYSTKRKPRKVAALLERIADALQG